MFILVQDNGVLPDGIKPLPGKMLIHHPWGPVQSFSVQFPRKCSIHQSSILFKIERIIPTSPKVLWAKVTLIHWGRVMHICGSKLTITGSDNGLSPDQRQAFIWTNDGISLIGPLGTNLSEILIKIHTFSFKKMHLKMSSGKRRPFCLGLNVLITTKRVLISIIIITYYIPIWPT